MNTVNALHKTLEQIALFLLDGQQSGQVSLHFNQGGLKNRNAPKAASQLVSSELVPISEARGRQKADITGRIICNMHEGKLQGVPRFELKQIELPIEYLPKGVIIPQGEMGRYISNGI